MNVKREYTIEKHWVLSGREITPVIIEAVVINFIYDSKLQVIADKMSTFNNVSVIKIVIMLSKYF